MPAVIPIAKRRQGCYAVLEAALPGQAPENIGILLIDPAADRGWVRLRSSFEDVAEPEDAEVLEALEPHIQQSLEESGAEAYLATLEDSLSNVVRVSERREVEVDAFSRVLDRLYSEHVAPLEIHPYISHLPLYSLRAAAGGLGDEMPSEPEDWVRAPEGLHLGRDLFVAHVVGRSMEPRIPDGSLSLFRLHPVGSRQNKILLIQRFGVLDETARYTVKKYTSVKVSEDRNPEGRDFQEDIPWRHERIRLEPLNPEFEAWDVGPEDFAVVAEWLRVIE
jgi:phage repressor protein C with HTH and peptisase S24 domain